MKKRVFLLIICLFTAILFSGCTTSADKQTTISDDKAFRDRYQGGRATIDTLENEYSKIPYSDYKNQLICLENLSLLYENLADELDQMPVTDGMKQVKSESIIGLRALQQYRQRCALAIRYASNGDFQTAESVLFEIKDLPEEANQHFERAKQLYEEKVEIESQITNPPNPTTTAYHGYMMDITYPYSWMGSYGDVDSQKSINGQNGKKIPVDHINGALSVVIQKKGGNSETLTVKILKDGTVLKSESTDSPYGIVSLTYTPGWLG